MDVEKWSSQLRKGVLELVILSLLKGGAMYGLEIIQSVEAKGDLRISEGTIYPLLSRLKAEGLIFSEWVESDQGRARKYYSLSHQGKKMLEQLKKSWGSFIQSIAQLMDN